MTERYEIRVRGRVSEETASAFEGLALDVHPVETVLHGDVADQAALHGILDRVQALGLELIEVRQLPQHAPLPDTIGAFSTLGGDCMLATTFWETFFLILIFLPLALVWAFTVFDIFRRDDIGGLSKALWLAGVIIFPFIGTLVYLVVRPAGATKEERALIAAVKEDVAQREASDTASELKTLADLHDRGKLTDAEFAAEKARLLGPVDPGGSPQTPA